MEEIAGRVIGTYRSQYGYLSESRRATDVCSFSGYSSTMRCKTLNLSSWSPRTGFERRAGTTNLSWYLKVMPASALRFASSTATAERKGGNPWSLSLLMLSKWRTTKAITIAPTWSLCIESLPLMGNCSFNSTTVERGGFSRHV
jgi:hypothetical protein